MVIKDDDGVSGEEVHHRRVVNRLAHQRLRRSVNDDGNVCPGREIVGHSAPALNVAQVGRYLNGAMHGYRLALLGKNLL